MSETERASGETAPMWAIIITVLGVMMFGVSVVAGIIRPDYNNFTAEAEGVVSEVEVEHYKGRNSSHSYITHVTFTDSDGRTYTAQSIVNGKWHRHDEGDNVTVRYDPFDPEAGILIKGDEDKLAGFNTFISVCRYVGGAALILGIAGIAITLLRK